jgi:NADH-quinone oxidoreductase subunit K
MHPIPSMINLKQVLGLTISLFFTGVLGVVLNRKNIIITILSIELMLLAVNINFICFSLQFDDIIGQIFVMFILTIAATESAIGLAILSSYHRVRNRVTFESVKNKHFGVDTRKRRDLNPQSST